MRGKFRLNCYNLGRKYTEGYLSYVTEVCLHEASHCDFFFTAFPPDI